MPELAELMAPSRCALIIQEMQVGVVGRSGLLGGLAEAVRDVGVIENLERLTAAARRAGVRVIHATAADLPDRFGASHNARLFAAAGEAGTLDQVDGDSVQPVPTLLGRGDLVLPRFHGLSPLTGSQLDSLLRNEGITTVVITGVSLNVAIPNLVFDAVNRSYQAVVPVDAVAGIPVEYGRQVIQNTLRPLATLVSVDELVAIWS